MLQICSQKPCAQPAELLLSTLSADASTYRLGVLRDSSPVTTAHLRCFFSDLSGIDDEFERVRILVLLHQLEVDKPFGPSYGRAAFEPVSGRFKQRGCEFVFAVGGQAFHCLDQLSFRHTEIVDQEFRTVGAG